MIYIHIPYCHRKCTYCAFYSIARPGSTDRYVAALCAEIGQRKLFFGQERHTPATLYFGGGTPSMLTFEQFAQIKEALSRSFDLSLLQEATLEANPEDLTPQYLDQIQALGLFNRLSIGVQSFLDTDLRLLNRRHNGQQAIQAIRNARQAGFQNISIDLIYGLPGQGLEAWQCNLEQAQDLPVSHLSAYALTIEPGTMLAQQVEDGRVVPANEETALSHYEALLRWCDCHGFEQYEISNFCRNGLRSQHNSRYWNSTPYLGIGAAAHSFDGHARRWNVADARRYADTCLAGNAEHESETLTPADTYNEYIMTALRTPNGICMRLIPEIFRTHLDRSIRRFISAGLIEATDTHYRPTAAGLLQADGIAAELFA